MKRIILFIVLLAGRVAGCGESEPVQKVTNEDET